jgi:hypothetical protein
VVDYISGSKVDMDVCLHLSNIWKTLGSIRGKIDHGGALSVPFFNVLFFLVLDLFSGLSCILPDYLGCAPYAYIELPLLIKKK